MSVAGFNDIPITPDALASIADALAHAKKALQAVPTDDGNTGMALDSARSQLSSASAVLEHLLERAASCH